ncbi:hypothetical protein ACP70R_016131 [Stipagrostis hirtigluma subsp. patula]
MPSSSGEGSPPPPPRHETPADWAALPRDIQCEIFSRLPSFDILRGAGLACAPWRRVAVDEPALWRHIDMDDEDGRWDARYWRSCLPMARAAIDRSAGRCESFRGPADRHLLVYLAARAPSLRSLHVTGLWCLPDSFVDRVIPKLPMLERFVLSRGLLMRSTMRALLDHCPRLELLDASGGDCSTEDYKRSRLTRRCRRKIKVVNLPRRDLGCCFCPICNVKKFTAKQGN